MARPALFSTCAKTPIRIYESHDRSRFQRYGCAVISGLRTGPFVIDTAQEERVFGIEFRAGGSWPFFAIPISELANQSIALGDLWHASAHKLREQLLLAASPAQMFALAEQYLLSALLRRDRPHAAVESAVRCFTQNSPWITIPMDHYFWRSEPHRLQPPALQPAFS
jgi:hypothetical protein